MTLFSHPRYLCEIVNSPSLFPVRICGFHPVSSGSCTLSCLAVLQMFDTAILPSHPQTFSFPCQEIQLLLPLPPPQLFSGCAQVFRPSQSRTTSLHIALYILMEFHWSHTTQQHLIKELDEPPTVLKSHRKPFVSEPKSRIMCVTLPEPPLPP